MEIFQKDNVQESLTIIPVIFCFALIIGIALGSWLEIPRAFIILMIGGAGLILASLALLRIPPGALLYGGLLIAGLGLGLFLISWVEQGLKMANQSAFFNSVSVKGKVISEKEIREKYSRFIIRPVNFSPKGKILLLADKNTNYSYGDILRLKGKLEIPRMKMGFDYQGYLAKDGIYWIMPFPQIQLINKAGSSFINLFYQGLYQMRSRIRQAITKSFSGRNAAFLRAILLGDKGMVDKEFRQQLSRSGTAHIVAISGLHLSILALFLFNLFLFLGLWRKQATSLTVIYLLLFLIFIGFRASLVRAVLMASLALGAYASGKLIESEKALLYIATLMLVLNPLLLRYDVGFQLSFLAVLGILMLYPALTYFLQKMKMPKLIADMISVTLAAQVFSLPIIAANFKIVSLVALFANFIVLSFLPFILALAFLWEIMVVLHSSAFLTPLLFPAIDGLIKFIQWTAHFPFIAVKIRHPSIFLSFGAIYYVFLAALVLLWKKFYQRHLTPLAQYLKWEEK